MAVRRGVGALAPRRELLREPEIGQVDVSGRVVREENVAGLDVAVDEPAGVGGVERGRDRCEQRKGPFGREHPLSCEELPQVGALDVAHRDVELAVNVVGLEDRDDVRVVEAREQLRLAQEALSEAIVLRQVRSEQLERHPAFEAQVQRSVHVGHPTTAEERLDPVASEVGADPDVGCVHVAQIVAHGSSARYPSRPSRAWSFPLCRCVAQGLSQMAGGAAGEVLDLLPAGDAEDDDLGLGICPHCREEAALAGGP